MRRPLSAVAVTPPFRGATFIDIRRRENARAVGGCRLQQRQRRLARIDHEVAVAHQRRGPRDAKLVAQRLAVEEAARQAGGPSRLVLALELVAVQHIAGEIERVAARDVGDAEFVEARGERVHGEARAPPGAHGVVLADLAREHDQRRVDLVLHERGAGDRRALGQAALVDDGDLPPADGEGVGDHRAGDAGADDEHVGLDVPRQAFVRHRWRAAAGPDRMPGSQVSSGRGHRSIQRSEVG